MKQADIVGIGVSVFDLLLVVQDLPNEECVMQALDRSAGIGGGVAVAMATAAAMGSSVAFADRLGIDSVSDSLVNALKSAGVDVQCVERSADVMPSLATVWVKQSSGSRTIVFSPGQAIELPWTQTLAEKVASAKILHLNGRHLDSSIQAIEVAKQSGTTISYDGGAHRYRREVLPIVKQAEILVVSEQFAKSHRDADTPTKLCQILMSDFGAKIVGVTCGDQGSWFASVDGDQWHQSAVPAKCVVDTTGCGDTFHGSLLAAIAAGLPLRQCTEIASQVASHQSQCLGAFDGSISQFSTLMRPGQSR